MNDYLIYGAWVLVGAALAFITIYVTTTAHVRRVKVREAQESLPKVTWYLNEDAVLTAAMVDTDNGFWEFYDPDDKLVMVYQPKPGDTLTFE